MTVLQRLRSPEELVTFLLQHARSDPKYNLASMRYRQDLVKFWRIPRGASVLDVGCGQGDFTVPVADAVGSSGRVVAIDPGSPDYGTPPIGESQAYVKASPVGHQIEFVQADLPGYLASTTETFDYIVFANSIWYFSDPSKFRNSLSAATGRAKRILIAEFALETSRAAGVPHLLTALAMNTLEAFRDGSSQRNLRCAPSQKQVISAAAAYGWSLEREKKLLTPAEYQYGWREATQVLKWPDYVDDVKALKQSEKVKEMLLGMRDAVEASVHYLNGGMDAMVNMDIWAGSFVVSA